MEDEEASGSAEELAGDEEWEEVDLDEYGTPIEATARPVGASPPGDGKGADFF
jgi:hypothetical protein